MAHPYASEVKRGNIAKYKAVTGKKSGGAVYAGTKPAFAKGGKVDEYKVGGAVSSARLDRRQRGGPVKPEVKPLPITQGSESSNKTNWMKNLSEKEIAQTLGSTSRDPDSGMRGHKKGGAVGKYARGGKAKGKKGGTKINIMVMGGKDKEGAPPMLPPPPMAPMAPPPGLGAGPGGPPGAPGGMPTGGLPGMNRGGKIKMKGGAETGVGRLDKAKAYKRG